MANSIFRGPITSEIQTVENPVVGTPLPGTIVHSDATDSTKHFTSVTTTQMGSLTSVLLNRTEIGQDTITAYVEGELGLAAIPAPGQTFQVRMAAATYTANQPLTITASGRLTNVLTSGDKIFAVFKGTPGAVSAGDLADVQFIVGRTVP